MTFGGHLEVFRQMLFRIIGGRHLNCVMQHDSKLAFEEC